MFELSPLTLLPVLVVLPWTVTLPDCAPWLLMVFTTRLLTLVLEDAEKLNEPVKLNDLLPVVLILPPLVTSLTFGAVQVVLLATVSVGLVVLVLLAPPLLALPVVVFLETLTLPVLEFWLFTVLTLKLLTLVFEHKLIVPLTATFTEPLPVFLTLPAAKATLLVKATVTATAPLDANIRLIIPPPFKARRPCLS